MLGKLVVTSQLTQPWEGKSLGYVNSVLLFIGLGKD